MIELEMDRTEERLSNRGGRDADRESGGLLSASESAAESAEVGPFEPSYSLSLSVSDSSSSNQLAAS